MKKRLFLIIAVLFCVLLLIATATACKDEGDTGENPGGDAIENPGGDIGENPGDDNPGGDVTENPEPEVYYTVTFDTQGGSAMASVEVKEGAVIGNVTLPTKQCAEFVGFAEDANGEVIWDIASDKVTGNITLYAIWEDAHTWKAWDSVTSIGVYAFEVCTGLTSVVFEDTEGWQVSWYSDFRNYTSLSSADLADASTAATYLKSTYWNYDWRKV